jgi:hypothetical protein
MGSRMTKRWKIALIALPLAFPAAAGEYLNPEQAHQFVAGKYFSYSCFEGTSGSGRIQADGSVAGTIRVRGTGAARFVTLPSGTIRVKPNAICASVRGMPMQPCFNVEKIDANSFRGSVAGLGFAYCTFTRRNPRLQIASSDDLAAPRFTGSIRRTRGIKSAEVATPDSAEDDLKLRPSTRE